MNQITHQQITESIFNGEQDATLDSLSQAIAMRRKRLGTYTYYEIPIGAAVRFNQKVNPTYLRGAKGKLVEKLNKNVVVRLDVPVGRFFGIIRTSPELIEKV